MKSDPQSMNMRPATAAPETNGLLRAIDWIALLLVVVGAINWGLVGLLNADLIAAIFGAQSPGARAIYLLVGVGGIVALLRYPRRF